jgi:hypothetical protein
MRVRDARLDIVVDCEGKTTFMRASSCTWSTAVRYGPCLPGNRGEPARLSRGRPVWAHTASFIDELIMR